MRVEQRGNAVLVTFIGIDSRVETFLHIGEYRIRSSQMPPKRSGKTVPSISVLLTVATVTLSYNACDRVGAARLRLGADKHFGPREIYFLHKFWEVLRMAPPTEYDEIVPRFTVY